MILLICKKFILAIYNMNKLETLRHSCAHLLAAAVLEIFPEAQFWTGPAIENWFYYDILLPRTLIPEDLLLIEKKMSHLSKQAQKFEKSELDIEKAISFLNKAKQPFKSEIASDIKENWESKVTFYKSGHFVDLCAGPHLEHTWKIQHFKLTNISWAYFRWDSNRPMMQRIYWVCFESKTELKDYLEMIKEAKKRDHRIIWKKLELFMTHEYSPWSTFFLPKWYIIYKQLQNFIRNEYVKRWYKEVMSPNMFNRKLWEISGHWKHYSDDMFKLEIEGQEFWLKPMNCPCHCLIYKDKLTSYRDLPLRIADFWALHRNELSWTLSGITRVRKFCQDDSHIFCTIEQVEDEIDWVIEFAKYVYKDVFDMDFILELSTRPNKAIWDLKVWKKAEDALEKAIKRNKMQYKINPWDWAFYWPKIDFKIKDSLGRVWQTATVQLDFNLPERFKLEYEWADWAAHRPVMIHRSIERFMWILIEHYKWAMPVFLAPIQVLVCPVNNDAHWKYAKWIYEKLITNWFRAEYLDSGDSLWKRIRHSETQKIPFSLVIWDKELKNKSITIRNLWKEEQNESKFEDFCKTLNDLVVNN